MVERACECAAGRVPVLVCVTDTSLAESIELARHAQEVRSVRYRGCGNLLLCRRSGALIRWFEQLATASPLPLLLR
ncbi:MAG: hypothetical protein R3C49_00090 [Planctomycetaceae bacterium]